MEQLADHVDAKRENRRLITAESLRDLPGIDTMTSAPWASSSFWMFTILLEDQGFGMDSRQLMRALGSQQIQCRPLWQLIHLSPAHSSEDRVAMPVSEELARQGLSLPCSVGLTEVEQDRVIAALVELGG